MNEPTGPRIFISVAEQSADEHASALIRAFRRRKPHAVFAGLAGPAMRTAGCETFHDMTARSAMALAAVRRVPEALWLLHQLKAYLAAEHFDAAVMVDSPTLNLPIARLCRLCNLPVLYYIAPQTWAWASWRNAKVRRRVNRLACIWPFEEPYFREHGMPATYVGHPSVDRLLAQPEDEPRVAAFRAGGSPVVTLLPGSRAHVIREVFPGQLEIAAALKRRFPRAQFLVVPANEEMRRLIGEIIAGSSPVKDLHVPPVAPSADATAALRAAAIKAADLVLVASGTITLEVAYHGTPMIVMYNAGRWMYELIGRRLISTPYLSIPNILAGREVVPEFMPYYRSVAPIIARAAEWLSTPTTLARIRQELGEVVRPIVKPGAADNAAAELAALLEPVGVHA